MTSDLAPGAPVVPAYSLSEPTGPLHAHVLHVLIDRIARQDYPVGSLIPTEADLAREFATSRFTIREALRNLTEQGYVERRQGVGTRVIAQNPSNHYGLRLNSLADLAQVAQDTYLVMTDIGRVAVDDTLAKRLGGQAADWLLLRGVRWTAPGGRPLCFINSYIPLRFEPHTARIMDHRGAYFALLEEISGETIEEVVQQVSAVPMPDTAGRHLGQAPGGIALEMMRRYVTRSGVLICTFNWHPGGDMTYEMRIRRSAS